MADIVLHTRPPAVREYFSADADTYTTAGKSWTRLRVSRDLDVVKLHFDHNERGKEQLHKLLIAVMDAFRQVDGAVQGQEEEVEVAA